MAEESINLPVTPEITKPDGDNLRRNSTGKPISLNSGENILPHYLRASTGSCHDSCKYGRKHAFEAKAKHPIPRRAITPQPVGQKPVESVVPAERKKTTMVKHKPSPDSKTHLPDSSVDSVVSAERKKTTVVKLKPSPDSKMRLPDSTKTIKREVSSPSKKVEVSSKRTSSNAKEINFSAKLAASLKPKVVTVKPSLSSNPSGGLSGRRNSDVMIGKKTGISKVVVKKVLAPPITSLSPKPSVNRVASLNARKYRSLKVVSPLKNQNRIGKHEPKQPNNDKLQEKILYVIKMETENKTLGSTQNKNNIIRSSPSPSPSSSPKSSSHPNSPSLSSHEEEDQEESEYTVSEADDSTSEDNESGDMDKVETSKGEYSRRLRKAGMVHSEDKDCAAVKLRFRKGKVVDLQSENSGPRRLRFRRGRVLGENQSGKGDARRRSFKKRGVDGNTSGTSPSSEKVVLRHQDVQGNKDARQGLFNNVIEETASKLVETRKSKVKALVGAFETVISLQESKPSTNTVT